MGLIIQPEVLANVLGTTATELLAELKDGETLKDNYSDLLTEKFKGRFAEIKSTAKKEGKGWGEREAITAREKALKAKYGVEGDDLESVFDAAVQKSIQGHKSNSDDIKNSDVYIADLRAAHEQREKVEQDFAEFKKAAETAKVQSLVTRDASTLIELGGYAFPDNEGIAKNLKGLFYKSLFDGVTFNPTETGTQILDANGNPLRDEFQKVIPFDEYVAGVAGKFFTKKVSDDRNSPGNKTKPGTGNYKFPKIETTEDAMQHLKTLTTLEEKAAFRLYFQKMRAEK